MIASLFALALLQAAPAQAAPANAPMTTATAMAASDDARTPRGAPADDYDFVAWCHGALAGHMALYTQVKPELVSIEQPGEIAADEKNDKLQMLAGRTYLTLYTRALDGVDHGRGAAWVERRKAAVAQGAAIWDPFRNSPPRDRMWAWVGWDLPGRCETAAHALLTPAGRLAALHTPAPAAAAPSDAAPSDAASPAAAPAPGAAPNSIDDVLAKGAPSPADAAPPPPAAPASPNLRGPQ